MTGLAIDALIERSWERTVARFDSGAHVVFADGGADAGTLARALAGLCRSRRGQVRLDERDVFRTPEARQRIGCVLADEPPLDAPTVSAHVELALALRSDTGRARDALEPFGLAPWLERRSESLSPAERRSLGFALALSHGASRLLVAFEPLAAGLDRARVIGALAERAAAGAVVVSLTGSRRDAGDLPGLPWLFTRGRLARLGEDALRGPATALVALTRAPRALAAALAGHGGLTAVLWDERSTPGRVVVEGTAHEDVAFAILEGARKSGAEIVSLSSVEVSSWARGAAPGSAS